MYRMISYAAGLLMLAFCAIALVLAPLPVAMAADGGGYTVDLSPLVDAMLPTLLAVLGALVSAALAWLFRLFVKYTGVQLDERHRKTLEGMVLSKLRQMLIDTYEGNRSALRVSTKSQIIAELAGYATRKAPDAVRHFKLKPDDLEEFVAGRLGPKTLQAIQAKSQVKPVGTTSPPLPKR